MSYPQLTGPVQDTRPATPRLLGSWRRGCAARSGGIASRGSVRSMACVLAADSVASAASSACIASAASFASIASVGSAFSIVSMGSVGSIASINSYGQVGAINGFPVLEHLLRAVGLTS